MTFNSKMKAVTFSFDDAVTQDARLIGIFDKYGLKCTFNLNSRRLNEAKILEVNGRSVAWAKPKPEELARIYKDHEIASHTLSHPNLSTRSKKEIIREVEKDRIALSEIAGYEVVGFAYPGGTGCVDEDVTETVRKDTGVKYARTTTATGSFELPKDLYMLDPTVHHSDMDRMFELGKEFLALKPDSPKLFYIWGHAYELDAYDGAWERFDDFCRMISGKDDIFYGTNTECLRELFD